MRCLAERRSASASISHGARKTAVCSSAAASPGSRKAQTRSLRRGNLKLAGRPQRRQCARALRALPRAGLRPSPACGARQFKGLPHRVELIGEAHRVAGSTTPRAPTCGSTVAALAGLAQGDSKLNSHRRRRRKGQDFLPERCRGRSARALVLIGRDAAADRNGGRGAGVPIRAPPPWTRQWCSLRRRRALGTRCAFARLRELRHVLGLQAPGRSIRLAWKEPSMLEALARGRRPLANTTAASCGPRCSCYVRHGDGVSSSIATPRRASSPEEARVLPPGGTRCFSPQACSRDARLSGARASVAAGRAWLFRARCRAARPASSLRDWPGGQGAARLALARAGKPAASEFMKLSSSLRGRLHGAQSSL